MQIDPAALMARPNRRRTEPNVSWSTARNGEPWTDEERELLHSRWINPHITTEQLAALHERSVPSCRNQANKRGYGPRPAEQSFAAAGKRRSENPAPPFRAKEKAVEVEEPDAPPPALKTTVDGVVLTARLDAAWARVEAGEDVATVAAELRCPTVEVLALRRWKAAA